MSARDARGRRESEVDSTRRDMRSVGCSIGVSKKLDSVVEVGDTAGDDAIHALGEIAVPVERGGGRLGPNVVHGGIHELLAHEEDDGAYERGLESMLAGTRRA